MTTISPNNRIVWIEALKGITICLVVIHHVTFTAQFWLWSEHRVGLPEHIIFFDRLLSNCRMPAFFFCSGLVLSKNVHKGHTWIINKRILGAAWIIGVWTLLSYLFETSELNLVPWDVEQVRLIHAIWTPFGILWFMYAIMICTIASYFMRNLRARNQILISLLLTVLAAYLGNRFEIPIGLEQLLGGLAASGFFFFIAGSAIGSTTVRTLEDKWASVLLVLLSIMTACFYYKEDTQNLILDLLFLKIPSTIVFIYAIRLLIDRTKLLGDLFSAIGSRSLSIFVTHQFVIAIALAIWTAHVDEAHPRTMWFFLVLFTAGGTFVARRYIHRLTGGLAYEPPKWLAFSIFRIPP